VTDGGGGGRGSGGLLSAGFPNAPPRRAFPALATFDRGTDLDRVDGARLAREDAGPSPREGCTPPPEVVDPEDEENLEAREGEVTPAGGGGRRVPKAPPRRVDPAMLTPVGAERCCLRLTLLLPEPALAERRLLPARAASAEVHAKNARTSGASRSATMSACACGDMSSKVRAWSSAAREACVAGVARKRPFLDRRGRRSCTEGYTFARPGARVGMRSV
jgi:hypothetical protein